MDTLVPIGLNQAAYTGHSVITTKEGAIIHGSDSGVLTFVGPATADFVTNVLVVGGTRQYAHATGSFVAPGVLDFGTGAAVGTYTAELCLANEDD